MATPVELPKLGNTVEDCLVSKWIRQQGDVVSAGDVVVEIETDKASFEVTAPVDGTVLETFVEEGALVPVFTTLFVIGEVGESAEAFRPQSAAVGAPEEAGREPMLPAQAIAGLEVAEPSAAPAAPLSPRARRFAEAHDFHPSVIAGSGPGGRVLEDDLRREYAASTGGRDVSRANGGDAEVTPARPRPRSGSRQGPPHGKGDANESKLAPASPAPSPPKKQARSGVREAIARRMRESLASTAQYTMHSSADASGLLTLRARIKASTDLPDITIGDLVAFCAVRALIDVPALNAGLIDGEIVEHAEVHLGFACDTPRGLLVPVVRNAHALPPGELALRTKALAAQALQGTIAADDLSGATFTISNLGSLGIESFTPLINPPQVAILGLDAIQLKPVRRHGRVELIDAIGLSLTCDHQVIDGAPGARFLKVLRDKIERVEALFDQRRGNAARGRST